MEETLGDDVIHASRLTEGGAMARPPGESPRIAASSMSAQRAVQSSAQRGQSM